MNTLPPDEPMAFSRDDVYRGAGWAWLCFMVLLMVAVTITAIAPLFTVQDPLGSLAATVFMLVIALGYTALIGGGVAFVGMLAGLPFAWMLARALRRTRAIGLHVVAFAALGATVGVVVSIGAGLVLSQGRAGDVLGNPLILHGTVLTTLSVVFGWWQASRHARATAPATGARY